MNELAIEKLDINGDRLNQSIAELAQIGRLPGGGVRRMAYSPEDLQARAQVRAWMHSAGMQVTIDAAGNLIGRYPGREDLPALATGSHIDTVPTGGRYDGALGVLAGIELVRSLSDRNLRLRHPIEVIVFTDEEGGMIGSKAMAGTASDDPARYHPQDGTDIQTGLQRIGGDWSRLASARRTQADIAAYIELHVEQGGILEAENLQIGVIEGIVSMSRCAIVVTGRPNHAGTTPMHLRQDALLAAAQVVVAVNEVAVNAPGQQVATVGQLDVSPNAINIVPGQVDLTVDIRDLSSAHLDQLVEQLQDKIAAIAQTTKTTITLHHHRHAEATLAHPRIQTAIARACQQLGLRYRHLPSRAIHDAQEVGRFTDMGMIFIPSVAGVSHAEDEYSSPEQCTQGANVLLQTFLQLDQDL